MQDGAAGGSGGAAARVPEHRCPHHVPTRPAVAARSQALGNRSRWPPLPSERPLLEPPRRSAQQPPRLPRACAHSSTSDNQ
eukprot:1408936-Pleurochrysis_carterae.AAC.2